MTTRVLLLLLAFGFPVAAEACAVCFGAPESKDTQALSFAILSLLAVLAVVVGSIVSFIVYLARHSGDAVPPGAP